MIHGNEIIFGYGDILVNSSFDTIYFQTVIPKFEIGTCLKYTNRKIQKYGTAISITFRTLQEIDTAISMFREVSSKRSSLIFKEYLFNFSKYNPVCVDTILTCLFIIRQSFQLPVIC